MLPCNLNLMMKQYWKNIFKVQLFHYKKQIWNDHENITK